MTPSLDLVEKVREVVARYTRRTPILRSEWLSGLLGADVFLKCENLQLTGSFKVRGAYAALRELREPVVTSSAGNHGLGLARAAQTFGVPCTVVVPRSVARVKLEGIRAWGAKVVVSPHEGYDDTQAWTLDRLGEWGGTFVSPFDDPAVIAGNGGTTALEIFEELPDVDAIVVPCGGGGCAIGAGIVARSRSPRTRIVGVNAEASPGMWLSRRDGRAHLRVASSPTIAEGIEGGVSERTFRLGNKFIDDLVVVGEAAIRRAIAETVRHERMIVEGSAAAGVAALLEGKVKARRICAILTGSNLDQETLAALAISENEGGISL